MKPRNLLSVLACAAVLGCGADTDEIRAGAQSFWEASRTGDTELAMSHVSESSMARINKSDDDSSVKEFTLGDVEVDGGEATVMTTLKEQDADGSMTVSFETNMIREDGAWKVDLDRTMGAMMGAVLGASMGAMTEAMGEAMEGAVKGMAEGMQKGFEAMADSLGDSSRK
jgi:hypothetical protein